MSFIKTYALSAALGPLLSSAAGGFLGTKTPEKETSTAKSLADTFLLMSGSDPKKPETYMIQTSAQPDKRSYYEMKATGYMKETGTPEQVQAMPVGYYNPDVQVALQKASTFNNQEVKDLIAMYSTPVEPTVKI